MKRPAFSTANLVSPTLAKTTFVPDGAVAYVVTLTVFDGKSSSTVATTTVTASASNLTINSTSYADGGSTPQGIARSNILFPQLSISDIPIGTKTLAITMVDEAQPCTAGLSFCRYWAVFNIPVLKATIAEGENLLVQSNVVIASNYPENIGYSGAALTTGARGGAIYLQVDPLCADQQLYLGPGRANLLRKFLGLRFSRCRQSHIDRHF